MKLLTYNFLTSKCIRGVKVGYPLKLNVIHSISASFRRSIIFVYMFCRLSRRRLRHPSSPPSSSTGFSLVSTGQPSEPPRRPSDALKTCQQKSISKLPPTTPNCSRNCIICCSKSTLSKATCRAPRLAECFPSTKAYPTCY